MCPETPPDCPDQGLDDSWVRPGGQGPHRLLLLSALCSPLTLCPWQVPAALCASVSPSSPRKHGHGPPSTTRGPTPLATGSCSQLRVHQEAVPTLTGTFSQLHGASVPESCLRPGRPGWQPSPFYKQETEAGSHWPKITQQMCGRKGSVPAVCPLGAG